MVYLTVRDDKKERISMTRYELRGLGSLALFMNVRHSDQRSNASVSLGLQAISWASDSASFPLAVSATSFNARYILVLPEPFSPVITVRPPSLRMIDRKDR